MGSRVGDREGGEVQVCQHNKAFFQYEGGGGEGALLCKRSGVIGKDTENIINHIGTATATSTYSTATCVTLPNQCL